MEEHLTFHIICLDTSKKQVYYEILLEEQVNL